MGLFSSCEHEWEEHGKVSAGLFGGKTRYKHKCTKCNKIEDCTFGYNESSFRFDDSDDLTRECYTCGRYVYESEKSIANSCDDGIVPKKRYLNF